MSMMFTEKIKNAKYSRIALVIMLIALAVSVLVLADVIYYYKGVITATVSQAPLTFFIGPNGYVPPYVITSITPPAALINNTINKCFICLLLPGSWNERILLVLVLRNQRNDK